MRAANEQSDVELLALMSTGDEAAFTALYRRHQGSVYRFAAHISNSAQTAEDVTQEVFMVLMRDANRFDHTRGSLQSFLLGIARNYARRAITHRHTYVQLDAEACEVCDDGDNPFEQFARDEAIDDLHCAIMSLPINFREAIVLCELQEMSYDEAATVIGCRVGTLRSRLHRARNMLTTKMRDAQLETPQRSFTAECLI